MFNEKLDLKLIRLVRDNAMLYDHSNSQYMDFNAREVVWQKIGDELKRPAAECKARWINIRDINRRILRKSLSNSGKPAKLYKYDCELSFMRPFYRDILIKNGDFTFVERNNQRDYDDDSDEVPDAPDDTDDSNDEKPIRQLKSGKSKSGLKKKRKKRQFVEIELPNSSASVAEAGASTAAEFDASDPVDSFLLSIGATLKTFSPYHLNITKSKIFAIVQEHDLQQIVENKNSEIEDKTPLNMI